MRINGIYCRKNLVSVKAANGTYLQAFFKRLAACRGYLKTLVATEHCMLVAVWHMLSNKIVYAELGSYFTRLDPHKAIRQALHKFASTAG
jgi:hypothetical protein